MPFKQVTFLIFLIFWAFIAQGQQKYEKEYRIPLEKVPNAALAFMQGIELSPRVKWYFEENLLGNSVEAKFKRNGRRYSVEFDTKGQLQDVEVKIPWREIAPPTRREIRHTLDSLFVQSKVDKIQIQYTGKERVLQEMISQNSSNSPYRVHYELVIQGKKGRNFQLFEILFTEKGQAIQIAQIVEKNTDHLEY